MSRTLETRNDRLGEDEITEKFRKVQLGRKCVDRDADEWTSCSFEAVKLDLTFLTELPCQKRDSVAT